MRAAKPARQTAATTKETRRDLTAFFERTVMRSRIDHGGKMVTPGSVHLNVSHPWFRIVKPTPAPSRSASRQRCVSAVGTGSGRGLVACRVLMLGGLLLGCGGRTSGAGPVAGDRFEFFEQRIRPILVSDCCECHGAEKQRGGLRVDFRDGLLQGGDSGPALFPATPATAGPSSPSLTSIPIPRGRRTGRSCPRRSSPISSAG